jgi:hypothetical protein
MTRNRGEFVAAARKQCRPFAALFNSRSPLERLIAKSNVRWLEGWGRLSAHQARLRANER